METILTYNNIQHDNSINTYPIFIFEEPSIKYSNDCAICLDSADPKKTKQTRDIAYLACGHIYHYDCLMQWQQTIRNYYFTNIECCMCKQHVSLSGIWNTTGKYTPINNRNNTPNIRDPLLHGKRIIVRSDPPNYRQRRRRRNNTTNTRYRMTIPGLFCCWTRQ